MTDVNRLAEVLPPRTDAPRKPKPPAPTVTCRTCGRLEVEVVTNRLVSAGRIYPHRALDGAFCHDANDYREAVEAWRANPHTSRRN